MKDICFRTRHDGKLGDIGTGGIHTGKTPEELLLRRSFMKIVAGQNDTAAVCMSQGKNRIQDRRTGFGIFPGGAGEKLQIQKIGKTAGDGIFAYLQIGLC